MTTPDKPFDDNFRRLQSKLADTRHATPLGSILFVEDETVLRTMLSRMLSYLGYKVTTAMNAEQALEIFDRHDAGFDMLITDVILPKMNGKELYKRLKSIKKGLRVIYISGYSEEMLINYGITPGYMHLLRKPFSLENISHKIRQALA
jgi:two-component system cell cycle sensor histidine kinase/response regulator CckA